MKKTKAKKGNFGYINREKMRRLLVTLGLFAIPLAFFFTGLILNSGDRKTIYTVIAGSWMSASMQVHSELDSSMAETLDQSGVV